MGSAEDADRYAADDGWKDKLWSMTSSLGSSFDLDADHLYTKLAATPSIYVGVHNPGKNDNYYVMFACSVCTRHTKEFQPQMLGNNHGINLAKGDERVKHAYREIVSTCLSYEDNIYEVPIAPCRFRASSVVPIPSRSQPELRRLLPELRMLADGPACFAHQ